MLYQAYEMTHAAISPMRTAARFGQEALTNPFNPFAPTYGARAAAAAFEMFIDATRRYGKPEFGIDSVTLDGVETPVVVETAVDLPFCQLLHFRRDSAAARRRKDPPVLIVAPMSGHFATLLRGTVAAMLPEHEVYITDWTDARDVPLTDGQFDLDDYADYLVMFVRHLARHGERPAMMAVCQPGIPAMVATAQMAMTGDPERPASVVLMGSPIDTASSPKKPNELATSRPLSWFRNNVILRVPWPNKGVLREVYPGFLQLSGFMSMNLDRHVDAHLTHYRNLIKGDGDSAEAHRSFYDEYMAVMDLTAEFYLQTIERVFQKRLLANNTYRYRGHKIDVAAIRDTAVMSVEGERDDITGLGQTRAIHRLLYRLPDEKHEHFVAERVGHYGVFNGSRWRNEIQPRVADFIERHRTGT